MAQANTDQVYFYAPDTASAEDPAWPRPVVLEAEEQPENAFPAFGSYPFSWPEEEVSALPFYRREVSTTSGFFWVLVSVLGVWAYLRYARPRKFGQLMQSVFSNRWIEAIIRDEGSVRSEFQAVFALSGLFILAGWIVLGLRFLEYLPDNTFWVPYLAVLMILLMGFSLRLLVVRLSGFLLRLNESMEAYLFLILAHTGMAGLALFPLLAFSVFGYLPAEQALLIAGCVLFSVLYISRLLRVFSWGVSQGSFSVFYIILYLCALEIMPVAVTARFLWDEHLY